MTDTPAAHRAKLSEAQRVSLLDRLDRPPDVPPAKNRRADPRYRIRKLGVEIRINQPGGGSALARADIRNISAGGLCLLHHGFLHVGTEVSLGLERRMGGADNLHGVVAWCRHVAGLLHLVGLRIADRIAPRLYVDISQPAQMTDPEEIDPATLTGSLLLIEDTPIEQELLKHYLKGSPITVHCVPGADEALAAFRELAVDLVLCELNLPHTPGEALIGQLRGAGFARPVVVLTAESSRARIEMAQRAGASAVLVKPYTRQQLFTILQASLASRSGGGDLRSTVDDPALLPMVHMFIKHAQGLARQLEQAAQQDNLEIARSLCQSLRGAGSGFGFPALSEAALAAVRDLDASMSLSETRDAIDRLIAMAARLGAQDAPPG